MHAWKSALCPSVKHLGDCRVAVHVWKGFRCHEGFLNVFLRPFIGLFLFNIFIRVIHSMPAVFMEFCCYYLSVNSLLNWKHVVTHRLQFAVSLNQPVKRCLNDTGCDPSVEQTERSRVCLNSEPQMDFTFCISNSFFSAAAVSLSPLS